MIYADGLDQLVLDLNELEDMPEDVIYGMLEAAGEIIAEGHRQQLVSMGIVESRTLKDSIQVDHKRRGSRGKERYILVYPHGSHHKYNGVLKVKTYKNSKHGRKYSYGGGTRTATANDVGFVQEMGSERNNANQWMRIANEKNLGAAVDAEQTIYEAYLKSKNL